MKTLSITSSLVAALAIACGGGSTPPAQQPTQPAPEAQPAETAVQPGDADNDVIPDKPAPFISLSSMMKAGSGGLAAAAPSGKPVAQVDQDATQRAVIRMFILLGELADGAVAATGDCPAMAASVRGWTERNRAELIGLMPLLEQADRAMTDDQKKALEKQLQPIVDKLTGALQGCAGDQDVMQAFQEMSAAIAPPAQKQPDQAVPPPAEAE